jgi:hypothetical protein
MTRNPGSKVVTGSLHRVQRGRGKAFAPEPPAPPENRPARAAVMLALAHLVQRAIDRGEVKDRAEVARRLGLTRARLTQLLGLTLLAPDVQERILASDTQSDRGHRLRVAVQLPAWSEQRALVPDA